MTTLEAIGFTIAGGSIVLAVSVGLFGVAVMKRHPFIAPRATARPPDIIYNPHPQHSSQDRGSPMLGWIPWTLGLDYDTMLRGVPGTGTREGGLSGSMLKVNLDGIILLRFHALCLRVSVLAAFLLLAIVLPMYYSAQCYGFTEEEATEFPGCASLQYNLTNYQRLTIENVPSVGDAEAYSTLVDSNQRGVLARLYFVGFIFWIITAYTLYLLHKEWVQVLAMRRVYWLEYDVWGARREELKQTLLYEENAKRRQKRMKHFTFEDGDQKRAKQKYMDETEKHLTNRDPWIPHPEQRDTVPNVALYSLLVGGLPSLPEQAADTVDTEATIKFSQRESIDWQLSLTSTFFDHCVPNQPGFSSSVAAVTIFPGVTELSKAWRKWYAAAAKLRRLRFIRSIIKQKRHYDIEVDDEEDEYDYEAAAATSPMGRQSQDDDDDDEKDEITPRGIYFDTSKNKDYFRQVLGSLVDAEVESHIFEALNFGPEQAAVYSREFAQASAACCPNGCCEGRIRHASIDELMEMERAAAEEVHVANLALRKARQKAAKLSDGQQETSEEKGGVPQAPSSESKSHRKQASLDSAQMPDNLGLEAELYRKASKNPNQSPIPSDRRTLGRSPTVETAKMPGELGQESDLHKKGSKTLERPLHRRNRSLELARLPDDLGLESDLYKKASFGVGNVQKAAVPLKPNSRMTALQEARHDSMPLGDATVDAGKSPKEADNDLLLPHAEDDMTPPAVDLLSQAAEYEVDEETGLRLRAPEGSEWARVQSIVAEAKEKAEQKKHEQHLANGVWEWPSLRKLMGRTKARTTDITDWAKAHSADAVQNLTRESTYAVITFTSRQAAVAARHCLNDGRGTNRWIGLPDIPIPPLADAPACDACFNCRNCCRPVSISINDRQKHWRNYLAIALLATIYIFYTVPLTFASRLVDPGSLKELAPRMAEWSESHDLKIIELISGMVSALIWSGFFALCPIMFKAIANFGSKATSAANAEFKALQYYWWFMVLTAYAGQFLANMFLDGINEGLRLGSELRTVLRQIAGTIPGILSANWLNWIIVRFTMILPLNYLLQMNTFLFQCLGWKCCSRVVRGGGPGGPTPYRIYVDSGVAFMCLVALAPASPLIAPACVVYFLVCQPLLRRNLIFMYRPKFDGGGLRFPFIFDMFISALVVAQILLTTQMGLKQALGPSIVAAIPIVPTILFSQSTKKQFLRAFEDCALLQTSLLDGWDTAEESSVEHREEFRRFLVDAHKAAFVPVCIAGTDTDDFLTAEPAVVVPLETDVEKEIPEDEPFNLIAIVPELAPVPTSSLQGPERRSSTQHGATLRRAVNTISMMRRRGLSFGSGMFKDEDLRPGSPFERRSMNRTSPISFQGGRAASSREKFEKSV